MISWRPVTKPGSLGRAEIEKAYGGSFIDGNGVRLLWRGGEAFKSILASALGATETICIQFYIFRNDETGNALAEVLRNKAREGVRVYMLYDHLGCLGTPRSFWREMEASGVEVRASRPFEWTSPWKYTSRDHRKLLVIDGHTAYTGGLNIANEYRPLRFQIRENWRDTGIIVRGHAAAALLETFKLSWGRWGKQNITYTPAPEPDCGTHPVMPVFAQSVRSRRRMRKLFFHALDASETEILMTTAYFTPSPAMLRCLEHATSRGVRVRLIVPEISDVAAAHYAGRRHYARLLRAGVEIYLYRGRMLHAKTYVFDRKLSIVGSVNLGYRSFLWNDEGSVGILDEGFAEEMAYMFNVDTAHASRVDPAAWETRPWTDKMLERFFALFTRRL